VNFDLSPKGIHVIHMPSIQSSFVNWCLHMYRGNKRVRVSTSFLLSRTHVNW